jgi:hypothetical protein
MSKNIKDVIILYGELYSKKNSKRVFRNKGKTIVLPSKAYEKAKPAFLWQLKDAKNKEIWRQFKLNSSANNNGNIYPIQLYIKIYRKTKRQFDYNNIIQGLQDMLVETEYLPDDNANYLIPHFAPYEVDPKNPRVLLNII